MTSSPYVLWACRLVAAFLMLQTLYFKFSGSEESIFIFTQMGMEPWGRIGTGIAELIASLMILIPSVSGYGALLAAGIMAGAILSHLFVLGIEVRHDGGLLFLYALLIFFCSVYVMIVYRVRLLMLFWRRRQ